MKKAIAALMIAVMLAACSSHDYESCSEAVAYLEYAEAGGLYKLGKLGDARAYAHEYGCYE